VRIIRVIFSRRVCIAKRVSHVIIKKFQANERRRSEKRDVSDTRAASVLRTVQSAFDKTNTLPRLTRDREAIGDSHVDTRIHRDRLI